MTRMLCVALFLIAFLPARAADMSVFGFEIGKPLDLPECKVQLATPQGNKIYFAAQPKTCIEDLPRHSEPWRTVLHFSPKDAPVSVKDSRAFPVLSSGLLIGFDFDTYGVEYQDAVLAQLREKYGKPTQFSKSLSQNGFGAKFSVIHAEWLKKGLKVMFDGADAALDQGSVSVDTPESTKARAGWESARNKGKSL